jgi:hypothetical protein
LALQGAANAKNARRVEDSRVAALPQDSIAGCLIAFGRRLIVVGKGLVPVRPSLISIGKGLILIGERLIAVERPRGRGNALGLSLARPVRRIRGLLA